MRITTHHILGLLGACAILTAPPSFGQATDSHAPPNTEHTKRIEGSVTRMDGNELLIKAKGGTTETYQLSPAVRIVRSRPGLMSDLSSGRYVSCANLYGQSEKKVAGECHIFPEGMQGLAGNSSAPESADTSQVNGTITDVRDDPTVVPGKGRRILIQISQKGGTITMAVSPVTVVAVLSAGDASALKPGARVSATSQQAVDGTGVIQTIMVDSPAQADHS